MQFVKVPNKKGRKEEWKDGGMEGWRGGGVEGCKPLTQEGDGIPKTRGELENWRNARPTQEAAGLSDFDRRKCEEG